MEDNPQRREGLPVFIIFVYLYVKNRMFECNKCGKTTKTKSGLSSHLRYCDGFGSKRSKKPVYIYDIPNADKLSKEDLRIEKLKLLWSFEEYRVRHSGQTYNPNPKTAAGLEIKKQKCRDAINKRYESGWMPKAGRCQKVQYSSIIAGNVLLDGSWELKVAVYLDEHKVNWSRNKKRFHYVDYNSKNRTYCPDFYLIDSNVYIEVKGYKTKLDNCKWSWFPEALQIWDKSVLLKKGIL